MIGQPVNRIDGPLKVSGRATYAYEQWNAGQPLYGYIVGATIGRGRVTTIDTGRAERAPGVHRIFTYREAPKQAKPDLKDQNIYGRAFPVLASADVNYFGEPVALAVADTFEGARAAAMLVDVSYETTNGHFDFDADADRAVRPEYVNAGVSTDSEVGNFDEGFARAPIKFDQTYTTSYMFSLPLEPQNALASWDGDMLTVYVSTQILGEARRSIAGTFGLEPNQVRIVSPFTGGGFGSKLSVHAETMLAVLAARELGQPVKIAATRQQVFQLVGNRPTSLQRVRLGASADGRIVAFGHETVVKMSTGNDYVEQSAATGRALYAAPHRRTTHRVIPLDLPRSEDVRAPGESTGLMALESAMDELAHELNIDPVELRIMNDVIKDPERGVPYGQRRLVECLREGARRFGWDQRPKKPASVRDGRRLVGYGMAASIRTQFQETTSVRARLLGDGTAIVQTDMPEIGTGTYTILAQVASQELGVPIDRVRVELGDSDFPRSAGSGGSWGASNSCTALYRACRKLREQVLAEVGEKERADSGSEKVGSHGFSGRVVLSPVGTEKRPSSDLSALVAKHYPEGVEAIGSIVGMDKDPNFKNYSLFSFGAQFAEVRVDIDTGEIRMHRMLGVFDAGRIFNPKTARSQLIGGMAWGVSMALHEEGVVETRVGSFINHDFAQYLLPVHADIPALEAVFLDAFDDKANELGAKGVGELAMCGSGAAVANAVFNATGVRVRKFPITIEKLLADLPPQE